MLVLTRCENESINIGDNVKITLLEIRGNKVRIGISAPPDFPVHREEVYKTIGKNLGTLTLARTTETRPNHHSNGDEPLEH